MSNQLHHTPLAQATQEAVCLRLTSPTNAYILASLDEFEEIRGSPTHLVLIQSSRGGTRSLLLSSEMVLVVSRKEGGSTHVISGRCTGPEYRQLQEPTPTLVYRALISNLTGPSLFLGH